MVGRGQGHGDERISPRTNVLGGFKVPGTVPIIERTAWHFERYHGDLPGVSQSENAQCVFLGGTSRVALQLLSY